jgi:hypothetical protein
MPFDERHNSIYENTIKPAIKAMNLEVKRGDDIFGTKEVIHDVWEYINKARFLIAVLNDKNPNVFYEVGISHAIGKKVIFISNKEEEESTGSIYRIISQYLYKVFIILFR